MIIIYLIMDIYIWKKTNYHIRRLSFGTEYSNKPGNKKLNKRKIHLILKIPLIKTTSTNV